MKFEEGQALAKKLHANFIETSAKDNKNISKHPDSILFLAIDSPVPLQPTYLTFSWLKCERLSIRHQRRRSKAGLLPGLAVLD